MTSRPLVLDTNIVLDVFLFADAAVQPLRVGLVAGQWDWLATEAMRAELARVLTYPKIAARLARYPLSVEAVLAHFDQHARRVGVAVKASLTCSDADDQRFIDLAVAHRAVLLSKDRAVLSMANRLRALGVTACRTLPLE